MTFLQPVMLAAMPLALLPVLIHLLNRLRYRTVKWAAIQFLAAASRSSIRRARLRHYLLLALRVAALAAFLLALARPQLGGWLGRTFAEPPETVTILLDRSASMEAVDPKWQKSKRVRALEQLAAVARDASARTRFVLIESALRTPHELADPSVLPELASAAPTDTAADIPLLVEAALDYMIRNRTGRTEIWIASDLQASNWRSDSAAWSRLGSQLAALPQDVRVRVLALTDDYGQNAAVSLVSVARRGGPGQDDVALTLDVTCAGTAPVPKHLPVVIAMNGARVHENLILQGAGVRDNRRLPLPPNHPAAGWGRVDLPADENLRDNTAWFAYGQALRPHAAVVADNSDAGRRLRLAAAPSPDRVPATSSAVTPVSMALTPADRVALLVWQSRAVSPDVDAWFRAFLDAGGTVLCFPAGDTTLPAALACRWKSVEEAASSKPFKVTRWEEREGPLASTEEGKPLSVSGLSVTRRQVPLCTAAGETNGIESAWRVLASFEDGAPFLAVHRAGRGAVWLCATAPTRSDSDLGDGPVLVPMVQRLLQAGARRLAGAEQGLCGRWLPSREGEEWTPADEPGVRDVRCRAGVYHSGARFLALNRPPEEDLPDRLQPRDVEKLLQPVRVDVTSGGAATPEESAGVSTEIWPFLVLLALAALALESWISAGNGRLPARPAAPKTSEASP